MGTGVYSQRVWPTAAAAARDETSHFFLAKIALETVAGSLLAIASSGDSTNSDKVNLF
jgi:hypothetical protein